jgi:hypothetical protein
MSIFRSVILIIVTAYHADYTLAASNKVTPSAPLKKPGNCEDTPVPDPVARFDNFPVHTKLADQVTGYNQPPHTHCQSKHFKYDALKEGDKVTVISRYKHNGT